MLPFLKKKTKPPVNPDSADADIQDLNPSSGPRTNELEEKQTEKPTRPSVKLKSRPKKRIFVLILTAVAIGASAYVVYSFYLAPKDPDKPVVVFQKTELKHIHLPVEILRFCFDHLPDLYTVLVEADMRMELMEGEIGRIEAVAGAYPEQASIAEKEKAVWEKEKNNLQKSFLKIEKPVKEIYVFFRVNQEQAVTRIDETRKELMELAETALGPARERTRTIEERSAPPKGLIKRTLHTLKKKFL